MAVSGSCCNHPTMQRIHTYDSGKLLASCLSNTARNSCRTCVASCAAAVYSAATSCVLPQLLSIGQRTVRAANLKWQGCIVPNTELRFFGERCGPNLSQIRYTAVASVMKSGAPARYQGKDCIQTLRPQADQAAWNRQMFGSCGNMQGATVSDLPTQICSVTGGTRTCIARRNVAGSSNGGSSGSMLRQKITLKRAIKCGAEFTRVLNYEGLPCGQNGELVQWTRAVTPKGCVLTTSKAPALVLFTADVFGSCGVPPGLASTAVAVRVCPTNPVDCKGVWRAYSPRSVT
jgi:hypothetical protein